MSLGERKKVDAKRTSEIEKKGIERSAIVCLREIVKRIEIHLLAETETDGDTMTETIVVVAK